MSVIENEKVVNFLLIGLVIVSLRVATINAAQQDYYTIGTSDSTGYNHIYELDYSYYENEDASPSTGVMKASGSHGAFDFGRSDCVLEVGYAFDAPAAGPFKVACIWASNYHI